VHSQAQAGCSDHPEAELKMEQGTGGPLLTPWVTLWKFLFPSKTTEPS
jgi:hypothetical protein